MKPLFSALALCLSLCVIPTAFAQSPKVAEPANGTVFTNVDEPFSFFGSYDATYMEVWRTSNPSNVISFNMNQGNVYIMDFEHSIFRDTDSYDASHVYVHKGQFTWRFRVVKYGLTFYSAARTFYLNISVDPDPVGPVLNTSALTVSFPEHPTAEGYEGIVYKHLSNGSKEFFEGVSFSPVFGDCNGGTCSQTLALPLPNHALPGNRGYSLEIRAQITSSYYGTSSTLSGERVYFDVSAGSSQPQPSSPSGGQILTNNTVNYSVNFSGTTQYFSWELERKVSGSWQNHYTALAVASTWNHSLPLDFDGEWRWRVRTLNGTTYGTWSDYAYFEGQNPNIPVLSNPSNFSETTDTTPLLDWNTISGATSYQVEMEKKNGSNYISWFAATTQSSSYVSSALSVNDSFYNDYYRWRVRARVGGTWQVWSDWSFFDVINAPPPPPNPPTALTPANYSETTDTTPTLSWTAVSGASYYQWNLYKKVNGTYQSLSGGTAGTSRTMNTLAIADNSANDSYRWRVRAKFPDGSSTAWTYAYFDVIP